MLGRVDGFLFNPTVNKTLAALDDSKSMFSVASRDFIDSSGRTYMEYKRDKHGGRERLLEEFLTFGIWGFGVRAMKQAYDASVMNMPKLGIKLPDLDIDLLPKATKAGDDSLQKLNIGLVEKFADKFKDAGQYNDLLTVMKSHGLQSAYRKSSILKFIVASGVPALAIAIGVPTLNQWLTRQSLNKEKAAKTRQQPASSQFGNVNSAKPPLANGPQQPMQAGAQAANHFAQVTNFNGYPSSAAPTGRQPFRMNMPNVASPFQQPGQHPVQKPAQQTAAGKNGQVQFGGMADVASAILQNERLNTLLIDGTISGGRVLKARNPMERFEIFFREAAIIAFLYWIQRPLQDAIGKQMGKAWKIPADMEFKTIQYLRKQEHYAKTPSLFHQEYKQGLTHIAEAMGKKLVPGKNGASAKDVLSEILKSSDNKEKALLESVYDYFLNHRDSAKSKNMIFETAIDSGLIPTISREKQSIFSEMNPIKNQDLTKNKFLDLTKKIDTKGIFSLMESLESLSEKTIKQPAHLEEMLKKTMRLRSGAWFASNAVCFTFLSVVIPVLQHYITYKRTGKNYFPGVQQEA
ncbi:MAG: hypothetical protein K0Q50_119 [Vampirovibrio sp.]|jgi:hypothetical protein|nr:hypothetical protein [Vampirovibrio sp.]